VDPQRFEFCVCKVHFYILIFGIAVLVLPTHRSRLGTTFVRQNRRFQEESSVRCTSPAAYSASLLASMKSTHHDSPVTQVRCEIGVTHRILRHGIFFSLVARRLLHKCHIHLFGVNAASAVIMAGLIPSSELASTKSVPPEGCPQF
jgi:hypothetical protein